MERSVRVTYSDFAAMFSVFSAGWIVIDHILGGYQIHQWTGKFATWPSTIWWLFVLITTVWGLIALFMAHNRNVDIRERMDQMHGQLEERRSVCNEMFEEIERLRSLCVDPGPAKWVRRGSQPLSIRQLEVDAAIGRPS